MEDIGKV